MTTVTVRDLRNHGGAKCSPTFDASCARALGQVAASLRTAGRKPAARAYDAMVAATAIAHGLAVFTGNPGDFGSIDGLDVHLVPHPDNGPG